MEERNQVGGKPIELTPEMEVEAADEPIIELTDVVEPDAQDSPTRNTGDFEKINDEIIELKEIVTEGSPEDGQVIELTEIATEKEAGPGKSPASDQTREQPQEPAPEPSAPEDIIELTEIVEPETAAVQDPDTAEAKEPELALEATEQGSLSTEAAGDHEPADDEQYPAGKEAEPDLVAGLEQDIPEKPEPELTLGLEDDGQETAVEQSTAEKPANDDKQVIDIAQALGQGIGTGEDDRDVKIGIEEQLDQEPEEGIFDDIAENLGLELEEEETGQSGGAIADHQQIEAALEKVIEERFGHRIEQLIVETIEKAVQAEIERIKRALLEDNDLPD